MLLAPKYVSIDCPAGDITLALAEDGSFQLVLAHWDSVALRHTSQDVLNGRWSSHRGGLRLMLTDGEIQYTEDTVAIRLGPRDYRIPGLRWKASTRATFADTHLLLEQDTIDRALKEATPRAGGA